MKHAIAAIFAESIAAKQQFLQENSETLECAIAAIIQALSAGGKILLFGNGGSAERYLYFVHSYVARPASEDLVLARCVHGESFPAAVGKGSSLGFQFHPEKSGEPGVRFLGAAISLISGGRN